jgi:hypothetical protein
MYIRSEFLFNQNIHIALLQPLAQIFRHLYSIRIGSFCIQTNTFHRRFLSSSDGTGSAPLLPGSERFKYRSATGAQSSTPFPQKSIFDGGAKTHQLRRQY